MRFLFTSSALASVALLLGLSGATEAATARTGEIDASQIVTYGGYEWVWASPCGAVDGCSAFDMSEQATYGWRLPSNEEVWANIVSDVTAFIDAFKTPAGLESRYTGTYGASYACAAGWFNPYDWCDVNDGYNGYVWNISGDSWYETFAIRDLSPVPVPAGLPLLVGALGGLGLMRRRSASRG
ncbi:VPLPA-CTERM sorting domain-containing protein [Celeribacter neptunius]|uniref:VPLPA-CTERM protein sorting domain-containing protein n=1 Tax=Celeribacter neptunius TaxID=588602 RepID=A0A1I3JBA5_9RHOB|nr:VPLPA-CTERM sorting domain-containing protein [Celeribacter neptunius]SFI57541.1 VPLPA-CTERM protein sorting domain-containing protein [Celeribacter neptunius]